MSHVELGKHYTKAAANEDSLYSYRTILLLLFTKISEENKIEEIEFSILLKDLTDTAMCVWKNILENLAQFFGGFLVFRVGFGFGF